MKLLTGKRVGQSGQELVRAVLFSFLLHVIFFLAALFLYVRTTPTTTVPLAYQVALVGAVSEAPAIPQEAAAQPLPPAPPGKKVSASKAKAGKGGMPELKKQKAAKEYVAEDEEGVERPADGQGSVAVTTTKDFKFPPFLAIVGRKIGPNWNPPPGAKGAKAKVKFTVLRSGRVADVDLVEPSGNFYFDQAALRAIRASSPFPPLPEEFFQESIVFFVDLAPKE